jgi:hypothetical protein
MQNTGTGQQMFNMLTNWQQSGISQKAYCAQHDIKYHVFHYWYKRFRDSQVDNKEAGKFIPLQIQQPIPATKIAGIELLLADGRRLLFNQPVGADFIKAIIS